MAFSLVGLFMFLMLFAGIIVVAGIGISKFSGRSSLDRELFNRLVDIDARLDELGDLNERLADLEERADFAERVLTDVRERKVIPPEKQ